MARKNGVRQGKGWADLHLPEELLDSNLFKFSVTLHSGTKVDVDVLPDVEIDYDKLESQLEECPSQFVFWFTVYSEVKALSALIERRIKVRRGVLMDEATSISKTSGVKLTQDQLKMVIEKDETLNKLEEALIKANKNAGKLYGMTAAMQMKSEHLRSLSGFKKADRERQ